jgi:hypothetical protein
LYPGVSNPAIAPHHSGMKAVFGLALALTASAADAQVLSGTVLDSATRRPIVGAVVTYVDSSGATISRGLTNEAGEFRVTRTPAMRGIRLIRMGFTPRAVRVPDGFDVRIDATMTQLPVLLAPVVSRASARCAARRDHAQALSLYELARDGLLATIVSRDANAGTLKSLIFQRSSEGANERIKEQSVRIKSVTARTSFAAVRSATDFVESGFLVEDRNGRRILGPDAETLLHPGFIDGYCFRIDLSPTRPRQVGLGFFAATRRPADRVDIDGTLWVDTASRVVKGIEFRYVGLAEYRDIRPGGRISFQEMPNGAVMIDQWAFRQVDPRPASASGAAGPGESRVWYDMREAGGELAHATWPNGQEWEAWLGIVHVHVLHEDGESAAGATLLLKDTDYSAQIDSTGWAEFIHVLPGPYTIEIVDSALASRGLVMGTTTRFTAKRGEVTMAKVLAPPRHEFLRRVCLDDRTNYWVTMHITRGGKPVDNAKWELGDDLGTPTEQLLARGTTRADGRLGFCHHQVHSEAFQLRVTAADGTGHVVPIPHLIAKEMKVELPPN